MRKGFEHYYEPSKDDFARLWNDAWFVFDTSALLGCYRNSASFIDEAFRIMAAIQSRLWLPHQVVLEYHENVRVVENDLLNARNEMRKEVERLGQTFEVSLSAVRHPYLRDQVLRRLRDFRSSSLKLIGKELKNNTILRQRISHVHNTIEETFCNVGHPYEDSVLAKIAEEGKARYERRIPPGYEDKKKNAAPLAKYGDLIIWKQMIDHAKATAKPVIFITEDRSEDWWGKPSMRTRGPHPHLRDEMRRTSGQDFYCYTIEKFVKFGVPRFLERQPQKEAAQDAETSERADEALGRWLFNISERLAAESVTRLTPAIQQIGEMGITSLNKELAGLRIDSPLAKLISSLPSSYRLFRDAEPSELQRALQGFNLKPVTAPSAADALAAEPPRSVINPDTKSLTGFKSVLDENRSEVERDD